MRYPIAEFEVFRSIDPFARARFARMKRATKSSILVAALACVSLSVLGACEKDPQPPAPPQGPAPSATSTAQKPTTTSSDGDAGGGGPKDAGYYPGSRNKPM